MARNYTKFDKGVVLIPNSAPTSTENGELQYRSSDDALILSYASTSGQVVIDNATQTLTNKTIIASALSTTGNLTVSGNLAVSGTSTLAGALTVNNNATVTGTLSVSGAETIAGALTVNNNATVTGNLAVSGTSTLAGALTVNNNATVTGTLSVSGAETIAGALTVNNNATVTGTATISGATLVNNTLTATGNIATSSNFLGSGYVDLAQISAPANPASNHDRLYFKSDDILYYKNSAGTETALSGGGAAAIQSSFDLGNVGLKCTVATNALTIALVQKDGATDPGTSSSACTIAFRDATAASGDFVERTVTAALSVVVPSGTTIGTSNGLTHFIYVYALDNAGTVELAVSLTKFDEGAVQTSTSISGGSSALTLYSTTGRSSKAIRLIGVIKISEATAGTWATAPSIVSLKPFKQETFVSGTPGQIRTEIFRIDFESGGSVIEYDPGSAISSITRQGTGDYQVNFNTAFRAQKDYVVMANFTASQGMSVRVDQNTSSQIECSIRNTSGNLADGFVVMFIVMGPK